MKKKKKAQKERIVHQADIIRYLTKAGIERISDDESLKRFISEAEGSVDIWHRKYLNASNRVWHKTTDRPAAYDILQNIPGHYDYRLGFLSQMVREINAIEDAVVVDAGCATGLDLGYLAQHYKNSPRTFIGYDKQREMIKRANKRKERLHLDNVDFYAGKYQKSKPEKADIVYASSSISIKKRSIRKSIIDGLKPSGLYIEAGQEAPISDELNKVLRKEGLIHKRTHPISKYQPNFIGEEVLRKLQKQRHPFLKIPLLREKTYYMDVYQLTA